MARAKRKTVQLSIGAILVGFLGYYVLMAAMPVTYVFKSETYRMPCTVPSPDPFDPSIKQFFWQPDPLVCDTKPSVVFVDESNVLQVNKSALAAYKISDESEISCSVRELVRRSDDVVEFSDWIQLSKLPLTLSTDFNRLVCKTSQESVVYDNIVHSIGTESSRKSKLSDESETHPSVLLFGVDSVSRSASIRYLPKTRKYLNALGAYDFKGFMKVGDNTYPNLVPLLTGLVANVTECPTLFTGVFDDYPFLWKNFTSNDYVTMLAEDMPHLNVFNNGFHGFHRQPTDHYMRNFWLGLAAHNKVQFKLSNVYRFLENSGVKVGRSSIFCNQNTPNHLVHINYLKQFFQFYRSRRKFVFSFLTELAHTFINFLSYGDDVFVDFLKWLKIHGFLDNTVVVVFSDHGSRFDKLRNTYVGRIESRMPMLSVVFPERLRKRFPNVHKALKENSNRLVTHFDLHQTLKDISEGNFEKPTTQFVTGRARGISLFQPITAQRSCYDAWVPEEYCACYKSAEIDVGNNPNIRVAAIKIVDRINKLLSGESQCERLTLHSVVSAQELSLGLKHTDTRHNGLSLLRFSKPESNQRTYSISLQTIPGNALFDATCELTSGAEFNVLGNIERTNMYGNQSHCVDDKLLKLYCYCGSSP